MTQNNDKGAEAALARLRLIEWSRTAGPLGSKSQILLMAEFLRRMAHWSEALGCPEKWPFFSVAERMAKTVLTTPWGRDFPHVPEGEKLSKSVPRYTGLENRVCTYYVQWCVVRDTGYARQFQLPDPYEPAISNFERGAEFYMENRTAYFGAIGLSIGTFESRLREPLLESMAGDYLDQLDAREQDLREASRKKVDP